MACVRQDRKRQDDGQTKPSQVKTTHDTSQDDTTQHNTTQCNATQDNTRSRYWKATATNPKYQAKDKCLLDWEHKASSFLCWKDIVSYTIIIEYARRDRDRDRNGDNKDKDTDRVGLCYSKDGPFFRQTFTARKVVLEIYHRHGVGLDVSDKSHPLCL